MCISTSCKLVYHPSRRTKFIVSCWHTQIATRSCSHVSFRARSEIHTHFLVCQTMFPNRGRCFYHPKTCLGLSRTLVWTSKTYSFGFGTWLSGFTWAEDYLEQLALAMGQEENLSWEMKPAQQVSVFKCYVTFCFVSLVANHLQRTKWAHHRMDIVTQCTRKMSMAYINNTLNMFEHLWTIMQNMILHDITIYYAIYKVV